MPQPGEERSSGLMKSLGIMFLVAAVLGPAWVLFAGEVPRTNVVLISIDTLRPDHLGLYGYERNTSPNIGRVFSEGTVFDRAYSAESSTGPSVVSFLTGLLPQHHRVRLLYQKIPDDIVTVADLLGEAGYQTCGVVSNMVLCREAIGLDVRFDFYDDYVTDRELNRDVYERKAAPTTDTVIGWLVAKRNPDRPFFVWAHYMDPHGPYAPAEDAPVDFSHPEPVPIDMEKRVPEYQRFPGVDDGLEYVDRYDEEIAYADREVGRLLEAFAEMGLDRETFFILTADHGEHMMDHDRYFCHGNHVYEEQIRVPLAILGEGFPATRVATRVSLVDVAPTILAAAGIEVPDDLDGAPLSASPEERLVFAEATGGDAYQWRCVFSGDDKWVVAVDRADGFLPLTWHYDIREDPEHRNLLEWDAERPEVEALLDLIAQDPDTAGIPKEYDRGYALTGPKVAPGINSEAMQRLRALGYVH